MADLKLKVDPELMSEKASGIENQKALMEGIMSELQTKVNLLDEYCISKAGRTYIEQYANLSRNIQGSLDTLEKHVQNLLRASTEYINVATNTAEKTGKMSTDGIFTN